MKNKKYLEISATEKNLKKIRNFIALKMKQEKFSDNKIICAVIVITEHIENIIKHSYKNKRKKIKIFLNIKYPLCKIKILDTGKNFDITKAKITRLKKRIKSGTGGKMGLKIIKSMTDNIIYKRENGYNKNIFVFNENNKT